VEKFIIFTYLIFIYQTQNLFFMPQYDKPMPLTKHPMEEFISGFYSCKEKNCSANNIVVEKGEYDVHQHSGDCYGSYTIACTQCGKREQRTFADN
jgi:hypothetical protein